jgi:hypothetical protein
MKEKLDKMTDTAALWQMQGLCTMVAITEFSKTKPVQEMGTMVSINSHESLTTWSFFH